MTPTRGRLQAIWPTLSGRQKKYVLARQTHNTKKAAAEACGLNPTSVYAWPAEVEEAATLYIDHAAEAALSEITMALAEAAMGKIQEMRNTTDPLIASRARTEILDRGIGKPVQHVKQESTMEVDVSEGRLAGVLDKLVAKASQLPDEEA